MEIKQISSAENSYIKKLIKLKHKKYREEFGLFVAEGERSVKDAVASDFTIDAVVVSETYYAEQKAQFSDQTVIVTTDKIFQQLCDTKTPQGILAVLHMPKQSESLSGARYIYCDCIQDPGNAGTIIRSADAFGFDGVVFSKGSVDVYAPNVIRSSMGSVFHIEMIADAEDGFLERGKANGYFLSVTALHKDSVSLANGTFSDKQIFVIGNEGNGVSERVLALADETVHIPMQGAAESLNAGVAASVLMYEVSRHA